MNIADRIEQAKQARLQSNEHKSAISMGIMDVTEAAVLASFTKHSIRQMIHGHTHRQNTHQYDIDGDKVTRYVLGDWHMTSSIMRVDKDGINIVNAPI
jgi:UDP-2,3-diacylglucosamine hydrolase